ncbi:DNA polymerase Y family protein [Salinicola endophyticus]|uniref:DNA polymerase Y family protein n=1 Tax=Salinicola endophyticus TaxID=1949083 RepID=A0AB74U6P3_9GAMM
MRWACLLFPRLALEGALRRRDDPTAPFALLEGAPPRQRIRAANQAARDQGVKPGQPRGLAEAFCPALKCAPLEATAVERWRQRLAAWAYAYSGQVSLDYPHALVFEVASSLALFGPWPTFEARLRGELAALGFTHRLVVAPNPAAARVLANAHDGLAVDDAGLEAALARLPLARSGLTAESVQTLNRSGFRRLGELFTLPRPALARRFGGGVMRHLGELRGEWPLALAVYRPAMHFSRSFEFERPVHAIAGLAFPLKRLLQELSAFLRGQDAGVERFSLVLGLEGGPAQRFEVGLLAPQRDAETLLELTRAQLERVRLEGPVLSVTLAASRFTAYAPVRRELLAGPARQAQAWAALHQRLVARLGEAALKPLVEHREHRPEAAVFAAAGPRATDTPEARLRPGWLLAEMPPAEPGIARLLAGPERIESGWWDGDDVRRDYYLAEWHDGRHAWVWREPGGEGFHLHGWFG